MSPATALDLYRIVQESLANVTKHAPGAAATITLDLAANPRRLTVRNPITRPKEPVDTSGSGLEGMRQRVAGLGGTLTAGPDQDHGWVVEVDLPAAGDQPDGHGSGRCPR